MPVVDGLWGCDIGAALSIIYLVYNARMLNSRSMIGGLVKIDPFQAAFVGIQRHIGRNWGIGPTWVNRANSDAFVSPLLPLDGCHYQISKENESLQAEAPYQGLPERLNWGASGLAYNNFKRL